MVEALARCGVGSLTLIDHDVISASNINRQLFALQSTVGRKKVQVAKERIRDIDENILVHTYETFYNEDTAGMFDLKNYDYIVDTIDTMPSKILLIEQAKACRVPVISCPVSTLRPPEPGQVLRLPIYPGQAYVPPLKYSARN